MALDSETFLTGFYTLQRSDPWTILVIDDKGVTIASLSVDAVKQATWLKVGATIIGGRL